VDKCGSVHSLPHTPSWRSACLVKHRDSFTLPLCVLFILTLERVTWNLKELFNFYDMIWTSEVRLPSENDSGAYPSTDLAGTGAKSGGY
jgi:hypothetical protein